MRDFIRWFFTRKPLVAAKQLTPRDIQLFSDSLSHIEEAIKNRDYLRIETPMKYLRIILRKVS
jgi:hypothetical protein